MIGYTCASQSQNKYGKPSIPISHSLGIGVRVELVRKGASALPVPAAAAGLECAVNRTRPDCVNSNRQCHICFLILQLVYEGAVNEARADYVHRKGQCSSPKTASMLVHKRAHGYGNCKSTAAVGSCMCNQSDRCKPQQRQVECLGHTPASAAAAGSWKLNCADSNTLHDMNEHSEELTGMIYLLLLLQLAHEGAANEARPNNANSKGQGGKVEAAVHCPKCPHAVLLVYQDGDVVLTAALCYRPATAS